MNIKIESPVNKYYVQTLCMIFFPGEKFGEKEEEREDAPSLYLKTEKRDGAIFATAELRIGEKVAVAEKEFRWEWNAMFMRRKQRCCAIPFDGSARVTANLMPVGKMYIV